MELLDFCQAIKKAFDRQNNGDFSSDLNKVKAYLICELDKLVEDKKTNQVLKMTRLSILFEGFYRYLNDIHLKARLIEVRNKRWAQHFGTPTIAFLLSYQDEIDQTTL